MSDIQRLIIRYIPKGRSSEYIMPCEFNDL